MMCEQDRPLVAPTRRRALALCGGVGVSFLAGARGGATTADRAGRKLVVILCRGAMDGLSVMPPVGDRNYAALRGAIAIPADQALRIDSTFALHPKLATLHSLLLAGEARIAPASAIPQRIRSHFDAQDLLESGGSQLYVETTGWLNRALCCLQPGQTMGALAVGAQQPFILQGPTATESWSPSVRINALGDRVAAALQDLYRQDPLLGPALANGLDVENQASAMGTASLPGGDARAVATTAARFLAQPDGPSIAVLSLEGFDTHARQGAQEGQLAQRLLVLDEVIAGLQTGLTSYWKTTVVIVVTEFGRTAHINGTEGTDHGTATTAILAGGALKSGGIIGDWPTLASSALFEHRDVAPTLDVRQIFKGVLIDHIGITPRTVETVVFPDSAAAKPVRGLTV